MQMSTSAIIIFFIETNVIIINIDSPAKHLYRFTYFSFYRYIMGEREMMIELQTSNTMGINIINT